MFVLGHKNISILKIRTTSLKHEQKYNVRKGEKRLHEIKEAMEREGLF